MEIRLLSAAETVAALPALAALLRDSIEDNASMGFMAPYDEETALAFWRGVSESVRDGFTLLAVARVNGEIAGTVQAGFVRKPNQPHRGDVMKLIVRRDMRGRGIARRLMERIESECLKHGRWLLVLDTATGSDAEAIYPRLGWHRAGMVPDYALFPDGGYCASTIFYKRLGA